MKKILIVYATAGEGHKRAALAIKRAFEILKAPDAEIRIIDSLDYTNNFFRWMYPRTYIFMVTYIPTIWGLFYYCLDLKWLYPFVSRIRRRVNRDNAAALEKFLCEFDPDVVICTHFLASEVIANLKRQDRLRAKLITCVTDFRAHAFWVASQADSYCVGFEETKNDLVNKWRLGAQKINITGIPVHPKFYDIKTKDQIRAKLNLSRDVFTILITGGGFGVGPISALVKVLIKIGKTLQILVVCGHNEKLRQQLNKLSGTQYPCLAGRQAASSIKAFGFIDYVDELMAVSDIAITKAGGLICSEAISKELPLIIIAPIPGQEGRNSRLLIRNRAAFRICKPCRVKNIIKKILSDKAILTDMRGNIKRIKKENPAANIASVALDF